jgi:hypothetical protein
MFEYFRNARRENTHSSSNFDLTTLALAPDSFFHEMPAQNPRLLFLSSFMRVMLVFSTISPQLKARQTKLKARGGALRIRWVFPFWALILLLSRG